MPAVTTLAALQQIWGVLICMELESLIVGSRQQPLLGDVTPSETEKGEEESREGTGGDSESDQPFGGRCALGSGLL